MRKEKFRSAFDIENEITEAEREIERLQHVEEIDPYWKNHDMWETANHLESAKEYLRGLRKELKSL